MGLKQTGARVKAVRLRTWLVTAVIVVTLTLLLFVNFGWSEFSLVDFVCLSIIQIMAHVSYFPDGESFGTTDPLFIKNKEAYNSKANAINENRETAKLREYCDYEYEERKRRYIQNECGAIGITYDDYMLLKLKSREEIRVIKSFEQDGKIVFFTPPRRKRLYRLLFKKLPIERNNVETIMSAIENDGFSALHDGSTKYKLVNYILKLLKVTLWGGFLAFIGYSAKDGITIETVVRMTTYLSSLLITSVTSFSAGEIGQRIYKRHFYVDLCNYIDGFNEWLDTKNRS